jgi:hypothetical protein
MYILCQRNIALMFQSHSLPHAKVQNPGKKKLICFSNLPMLSCEKP